MRRHFPGIAMTAVIALTMASCAGPYVDPAPGGIVTKSARLGWYRKKVVAKNPPETLIAEDATICRVAPDLFSRTRVGSVIYCNWQ